MAVQLRGYQQAGFEAILAAWASGLPNVAYQLPTGGGKTVLFSHTMHERGVPAMAIAHRQELVGQISLALAREGVEHRVIAPDTVRAGLVGLHVREFGRSFIGTRSEVAVAGVDTMIRRTDPFYARARLWVMDEAHHVLRANKWGKAVELLPNAQGLGVTATPERADGKGLGRHADGVFDTLICGPSMRELIEDGFLTEYRVLAPRSDLDLSQVAVSQATGDYNAVQLRKAVHKSKITGDVVAHYLKHAAGLRGITFAVDVEEATKIADAFNAAGVPAAVVSAESPDPVRAEATRRLRSGALLQLVNVDLFGEGFDLPAIEVVSFARPTESFSLYCQQFGRVLRTLEGKTRALILDHVGNVIRHGLPDAPRQWTLDARDKRARSSKAGELPLTSCPECTAVYFRYRSACPECGYAPEPAGRATPEQVDGDLFELDPEVLARMRGDIARVDGAPRYPYGADGPTMGAIKRAHFERQEAQAALRDTIALWAGYNLWAGRTDAEGYRIFFQRFGVDVATAQALGAKDAHKLRALILENFT